MSVEAATSVGMDPFRLRSGIWRFLTPSKRRAFFRDLEKTLRSNLESLREREEADPVDVGQTELAIALVETRIAWLRRQMDLGT